MRRLAALAALACCAAILAGCAATRPEPSHAPETSLPAKPPPGHPPVEEHGPDIKGLEEGDIVTPRGTVLSLERAARFLRGADVSLLGEDHTSPCDHKVQAKLVSAMADLGPGPVVGLEMVPLDMAGSLARFNAGEIGHQELEDELAWSETWGFPYRLYEPVFKAANEHSLPLAALNAPRETVLKVSESGLSSLDYAERAEIPETVIPPRDEQREMLRTAFEHHEQSGDEDEAFERFLLIQSLWDTTMAARILEARETYGEHVTVIVGGGHVEFGWGIPHRLKVLSPETSVALVIPWRGPQQPLEGADLFYYCPRGHRSSLGMALEERDGRVAVTGVETDSRAQRSGLEVGDIIVTAGGREVTSLSDLHEAGYEAYKDETSLKLEILRDGERLEIDFAAAER